MLVRSNAIVLALVVLCACAHVSPAKVSGALDCDSGSNCTIAGPITIVEIGNIKMGKVMLPDGECVSVSLPDQMVNQFSKSVPAQTTLKGTMFPVPDDIEVATIAVKGRKIGLRQCGNRYLFVE